MGQGLERFRPDERIDLHFRRHWILIHVSAGMMTQTPVELMTGSYVIKMAV